jgi:hypothetical protein
MGRSSALVGDLLARFGDFRSVFLCFTGDDDFRGELKRLECFGGRPTPRGLPILTKKFVNLEGRQKYG